MQKWHYKTIVIRDLALSDSKLNVEGEHGWDLVAVITADGHTARAFFKQAYEGEAPSTDVAHHPEAVAHV
jgi:hypothetical protein